MCCCGNTGEWNRYENRSQHRKLTLEKKILPPCRPTAVLAGVSLHGPTASLKREKNCSTCSADCGPVWHRQSSVCASPRSKHMKGSKERLFTRKTLIYYDIFLLFIVPVLVGMCVEAGGHVQSKERRHWSVAAAKGAGLIWHLPALWDKMYIYIYIYMCESLILYIYI